MKIVVLGTRGFPNIQGGVENHCENLYLQLAKRGCEVIVFVRKPYVAFNNSEIYEGVKLIPLPCPKNKFLEAILHTFFGVLLANKIQPDVLHIHAVGPSFLIPLARILGLKVVMTNHGPDYQRKKWNRFAKMVLRLGENLGSRWANDVICVSESIAESIRKKYKREVKVIPNGVNTPKIIENDGILQKYSLEKRKYILAVGRFVPEKGFHILIEAFCRLKLNDWKLVIAGRADHEDAYSLNLKKEAGKDSGIILTGFLTGEALEGIFSHAGIFVIPSFYEGLPIVLLEALSYGLSCIASDIESNRNAGLPEDRLFKTGDVSALSKKIKMFMARPLSEAERERQIFLISEKYNWEKIADKTLEIYYSVMNR